MQGNQITRMDIHTLYPMFVMHQVWDKQPGFNQRLYEICVDSYYGAVKGESNDPRDDKRDIRYISHHRANLFEDVQDPVVAEFASMVESMVRDYLRVVYHNDYQGDLEMRAQPFLQRGGDGENGGVNMHTHQRYDLVVTYYPKFESTAPEGASPFHKGSVRFYDTSGRGSRRWDNKNPSFFSGGGFTLEPKEGSMVLFEGNAPHDSTFFFGGDRMCIPVMINVLSEKASRNIRLSKIKEMYQ